MKQKILASEIAGIDDFPAAAAAHAVEMKNWRAHQSRVQQDLENEVPRDRAHWPQPQPRAHPLVERAVDENDEANFEIVNDLPDPLVVRKAHLAQEVTRAEHAAVAAVVPALKARFFDLRENDIRAADSKLLAELRAGSDGVLRKISGKSLSPEEMARAVEDARHPDDTRHLADQADRRARIEAIQRKAAQAHHDIEDLTADTIGSWTPPTF